MARIQWNHYRRTKARDSIAAVWDSLTVDQTRRGMQWYADAQAWCKREALHTPFNQVQVAAIVAVLSPGNGWHQNLADASAAMALHSAGHTVGEAREARAFTCYPSCLEKAWRIMDGEEPANVVGGAKVIAFWHNLSGDETHVTIDRHAITAAGFKPEEVDAVARRKDWREGVARVYRELAASMDITPAQAQACVWVGERENMKGHAEA